MYCTQCGIQLQEKDEFCSQCGRATPLARDTAFTPRGSKRLRRLRQDKKFGGVCAGLAEYLEVDVVLTRVLVMTGIIVSGGLGLLAYIAAWIIIPLEPLELVYHGAATAR